MTTSYSPHNTPENRARLLYLMKARHTGQDHAAKKSELLTEMWGADAATDKSYNNQYVLVGRLAGGWTSRRPPEDRPRRNHHRGRTCPGAQHYHDLRRAIVPDGGSMSDDPFTRYEELKQEQADILEEMRQIAEEHDALEQEIADLLKETESK